MTNSEVMSTWDQKKHLQTQTYISYTLLPKVSIPMLRGKISMVVESNYYVNPLQYYMTTIDKL
jgi:hypothetical protein